MVFAADGSRLGYVQSDMLRRVVPWRDMPVELRQATVAIEDERFYEHDGVDLKAIVRAGIKNLESGKTVQGGSTITQQLVRALYIQDPKRDIKRKIREAKLASELEEKHSKRWILDEYLNSVPYGTVGGRTAIGVEAAAVTSSQEREGPDAVPSRRCSPACRRRRRSTTRSRTRGPRSSAATRCCRRWPTTATSRRPGGRGDGGGARAEARHALHAAPRAVLLRLRPAAADRAVRRRRGPPGRAEDLHDDRPEDAGPGARGDRAQLGDRPARARRSSSVEPATGYIRAMASSGTYNDRTFNLAAQGHRQPGSAFKTMVLTTAIRKGVDPDRPLRLEAARRSTTRATATGT